MTRGKFCVGVGAIAVVAFLIYGQFFDQQLEHLSRYWLLVPLFLLVVAASGGEGPGPLGYD